MYLYVFLTLIDIANYEIDNIIINNDDIIINNDDRVPNKIEIVLGIMCLLIFSALHVIIENNH